MIKDNQKYFNRMHVVMDGVIILVSYLLAYYIRLESGLFPQKEEGMRMREYMLMISIIVPYYCLLYTSDAADD